MQHKGPVRSVALANQKGGVGKTTTAIHLAHALAIGGAKVVLLDLDPQGNASVGVGADSGSAGRHPLLVDLVAGFSILPTNMLTSPAQLSGFLNEIGQLGFEWIVADCPPRMDEWGWAGVQSCAEVIVPVQTEFFAMQGLSQMLATLNGLSEQGHASPKVVGVLPTMVNPREQVSREVLADLRSNLGSMLFETPILRDPEVIEAASHGQTLFDFNPAACATLCFSELAREVVHGRSKTG
jgi:chromosome partitioning protein